jgi:hypothetical protein
MSGTNLVCIGAGLLTGGILGGAFAYLAVQLRIRKGEGA